MNAESIELAVGEAASTNGPYAVTFAVEVLYGNLTDAGHAYEDVHTLSIKVQQA